MGRSTATNNKKKLGLRRSPRYRPTERAGKGLASQLQHWSDIGNSHHSQSVHAQFKLTLTHTPTVKEVACPPLPPVSLRARVAAVKQFLRKIGE